MKKTIFETNYDKLNKILQGGLDAFVKNGEYKNLKAAGFMDLNIDNLGDGRIALSHNYECCGDLVPDPDMEIKVYPEQKMVEALTYQDATVYQQVYVEKNGKQYVYPKLKKDLNKFLGMWLTNIIKQGHKE